jgi:hypothetical protein
MWQSHQNQALIVLPGVNLTESIDRVVAELDPFFIRAERNAFVTSGLRDAEDQVHLIQSLGHRYNLLEEHPEARISDLRAKMTWRDGTSVYTWQPLWSNLLKEGIIVNPPLPAICLFDSFRDDGSNRRGKLIQATPHRLGKAFDIGGGAIGPQAVLEVVAGAKLPSIKSWLVERKNNALHVDVA